MRVVEMRVGRRAFGETLGAMREWMDRVGAGSVKFESESDSNGLIVIRLEFGAPEMGFAFCRDWQIETIDAAPVAA